MVAIGDPKVPESHEETVKFLFCMIKHVYIYIYSQVSSQYHSIFLLVLTPPAQPKHCGSLGPFEQLFVEDILKLHRQAMAQWSGASCATLHCSFKYIILLMEEILHQLIW